MLIRSKGPTKHGRAISAERLWLNFQLMGGFYAFPANGFCWRFSLVVTVGLDQCSYSMLGPVNAWMGDRLQAGKLSRM